MNRPGGGRSRAGLILALPVLLVLCVLALGTAARGDSAAAPLAADEGAAVAFDGTNYLVVWSDYASGTGDIYGARVAPNGTVLDPGPGLPISTPPAQQILPAVALDGTNYLVVRQERRTNDHYDIYAARVTPAGAVLDPDGIPIATAAGDQTAADITFDGVNYFVTWTDWSSSSGPDIYGARVTTSGTVLDPDGIPISNTANDQSSASVAFDGTNYLVTWEDRRSDPAEDIWGARVSTNGTVLDPAGISIGVGAQYQLAPDVAFDGTNFLVSWMDRRIGVWNIYGARVTPAGSVLEPDGIPISTAPDYQVYPALAFGQANYLVVWTDKRDGLEYHIHGARVTPGGSVLEPGGIPISTAAQQDFPAVAFGGSNYLAVWEDDRSQTGSDIYASRLSPAGDVLDPTGILISNA